MSLNQKKIKVDSNKMMFNRHLLCLPLVLMHVCSNTVLEHSVITCLKGVTDLIILFSFLGSLKQYLV